MSVRDKLFGFSGRLNRANWWGLSIAIWALTLIGAAAVRYSLFGPAHAVGGLPVDDGTRMGRLSVSIAIGLIFLWPVLALTAKRAHDSGRSAGPMVALALLGKLVGWGVAFLRFADLSRDTFVVTAVLSLPALAIQLYLLVILGFAPGTPGPNRYGPSPDGKSGTTADPAAVFD